MSELEAILDKVGAIDGVKGVILFSDDGKIISSQFSGKKPGALEKAQWISTFKPPAGIDEIELTYEEDRILIRRSPQGYLLVWMAKKAQPSMVKLNCDVALSALGEAGGGKGLFGLFGKGKKGHKAPGP